jgi:hypothetical protein
MSLTVYMLASMLIFCLFNAHIYRHEGWTPIKYMQHGYGQQHKLRHTALTMDMNYGQRHAAWTWRYSMDIDMQHVGHAEWTWSCIKDMGRQQGHAYTAWTCILHMLQGHGHVQYHGDKHGKGHAPWT